MFLFYLLLVHAALGIALWKTDLLPRVAAKLGLGPAVRNHTDHFDRMVSYHQRTDKLVPEGSTIFIGDSHTLGLCVTAVVPSAVNYGIGGDTTVGVLDRLPVYPCSIANASKVVIAIGVNDLPTRSDDQVLANFASILDSLQNVPVLISSILPLVEEKTERFSVSNARINRVNEALKLLAAERAMVDFLDNRKHFDADGDGELDEQFHDGGGLHLSPEGNRLWARLLRDALKSSP